MSQHKKSSTEGIPQMIVGIIIVFILCAGIFYGATRIGVICCILLGLFIIAIGFVSCLASVASNNIFGIFIYIPVQIFCLSTLYNFIFL